MYSLEEGSRKLFMYRSVTVPQNRFRGLLGQSFEHRMRAEEWENAHVGEGREKIEGG